MLGELPPAELIRLALVAKSHAAQGKAPCHVQVEVSMAMGVPLYRWMVSSGKCHLEMDDTQPVALFQETSRWFLTKKRVKVLELWGSSGDEGCEMM